MVSGGYEYKVSNTREFRPLDDDAEEEEEEARGASLNK